VFSAPYIRSHFRKRQDFPSGNDVSGIYDTIRKLWSDNYSALRKQNEAFTRTQFIDPVLRHLGWHFLTESNMPREKHVKTRKRPDYCLFTQSEALTAAAAGTDTDIYRASATVQLTFATDPKDCLTILERAVSWSAEKLYGVEDQGPFDEF